MRQWGNTDSCLNAAIETSVGIASLPHCLIAPLEGFYCPEGVIVTGSTGGGSGSGPRSWPGGDGRPSMSRSS